MSAEASKHSQSDGQEATAHAETNGDQTHKEDVEEIEQDPGKVHDNFYKLPSALQTNFDAIEDKPWYQEGADITDYFNYGFDEEMFRIYQSKVRENFNNLNRESLQQEINTNQLQLENDHINFHLPHEAGGVGVAKSYEYARVNTYRLGKVKSNHTGALVEDDPPVLCNKSQGYFVKIIKNGLQNIPEIPIDEGEGDMMENFQGMMNSQMMANNAQMMSQMISIGPDGMPIMQNNDDSRGHGKKQSNRNGRRGNKRDNKNWDKRDDDYQRPESRRDGRHSDSRHRSSRNSPNKRRDDRRDSYRDRDSGRDNGRYSGRNSDRDSGRDYDRDSRRESRRDNDHSQPDSGRRERSRDNRRREDRKEDRSSNRRSKSGERSRDSPRRTYSRQDDRQNERSERDHRDDRRKDDRRSRDDYSSRNNDRDRNAKRKRSSERDSYSNKDEYKRARR